MARNRMIKPDLWRDDKLTLAGFEATALFAALLNFVDDKGRMQYSPRAVKLAIIPGDEDYTPEVIDGMIHDLAKVGVIELYEKRQRQYLRIINFLKHQYIQKPSHTDNPPSPTEGEREGWCNCRACIMKRRAKRNGDDGDEETFPQERSYQHDASNKQVSSQHDGSVLPVSPEVELGIGIGIGRESLHGKSSSSYIHGSNSENDSQNGDPQTSEEHGPSRSAALDALARGILGTLRIPANDKILQVLTRSIEVKARSRQWSLEAAANNIVAHCAPFAVESPPESWEEFLYDVRYEYVAAGDPKLADKRIEARPTCGGSNCQDGWETLRIADKTVSRRCPACAQLWE